MRAVYEVYSDEGLEAVHPHMLGALCYVYTLLRELGVRASIREKPLS